jgi:hypothetical protein
MERNENKGRQREKEATTCVHRMSKEEDSLLWREASVQALLKESDTMRLQGYHTEGSAENRLYGYVGQAFEAHGRPCH